MRNHTGILSQVTLHALAHLFTAAMEPPMRRLTWVNPGESLAAGDRIYFTITNNAAAASIAIEGITLELAQSPS